MGTTSERKVVASESPYETSPNSSFSRAMRVGSRILVSGTAPIWPDGSCPDDAKVQAQRCFEIIGAALRGCGSDFEHVVSLRIYLTDPSYFDAIAEVQKRFLGSARPTATAVVTQLLDPRWKLEVAAEAID